MGKILSLGTAIPWLGTISSELPGGEGQFSSSLVLKAEFLKGEIYCGISDDSPRVRGGGEVN
jgi:hypothetical protein